MVVCICNAIREHQVRAVARNGCQTACQAYRALGCEPKCGQCAVVARAILEEERSAA